MFVVQPSPDYASKLSVVHLCLSKAFEEDVHRGWGRQATKAAVKLETTMDPAMQYVAGPRRVGLRNGREVTIRLLERRDGEAMVEFYAAIPDRDGIYYLPPSGRTREKALARAAMADDPYEVCLVLADDAGGIHGEAWYRWAPERMGQSTFGIGIRRTVQGVGAGRAIMGRLMEIGDVHGPRRMDLTVQVENERAWRLYTSMGFVRMREQMRAPREDAPAMAEFFMVREMGGRRMTR